MTGEAGNDRTESVTGELRSISERFGMEGRLFPDGTRSGIGVKVRFQAEYCDLAREAVRKRVTVTGQVVTWDVAGRPARIEMATLEETPDQPRRNHRRSGTKLGPALQVRFELPALIALDRLAADEGVSLAEMVRRLVDAGISQAPARTSPGRGETDPAHYR